MASNDEVCRPGQALPALQLGDHEPNGPVRNRLLRAHFFLLACMNQRNVHNVRSCFFFPACGLVHSHGPVLQTVVR